jgi:hypothetical protein
MACSEDLAYAGLGQADWQQPALPLVHASRSDSASTINRRERALYTQTQNRNVIFGSGLFLDDYDYDYDYDTRRFVERLRSKLTGTTFERTCVCGFNASEVNVEVTVVPDATRQLIGWTEYR